MDGSSTVASCYRYYAGRNLPYDPLNKNNFALALIWKMVVPYKIKAFGCRLFVNRLLTKDLLVHRKIVVFGKY